MSGPEAGGPAVALSGVSKSFVLRRGLPGRPSQVRPAVVDVSFAVERGRTLALVGESGAGKSTVGRMVVGLVPPDRGAIRLLGEEPWRRRGRRRRSFRRHVSMIFQDPFASFDPKMTMRANVGEPLLAIERMGHRDRERRIAELVERVGLGDHFLDRFPYELSGGQLQRLAIVRALATRPAVLVCDEPVAALDMSTQGQVVNLLTELQRELGLTYLFITHDLSLVRAIADDVAVMRSGAIVERALPERVFAAPEHPYTRDLLAAVPVADPRRRSVRAPVAG